MRPLTPPPIPSWRSHAGRGAAGRAHDAGGGVPTPAAHPGDGLQHGASSFDCARAPLHTSSHPPSRRHPCPPSCTTPTTRRSPTSSAPCKPRPPRRWWSPTAADCSTSRRESTGGCLNDTQGCRETFDETFDDVNNSPPSRQSPWTLWLAACTWTTTRQTACLTWCPSRRRRPGGLGPA